MLLFWPLVHGQWKDLKDRAKSRTTTEECLHQILEVALRQDYSKCKFLFCFANSITLFKKLIRGG